MHETPVGFKYIGELITQDRVVLGGEESAGLSVKGHVPEKDGILACLLAGSLLAGAQAPLDEFPTGAAAAAWRCLTVSNETSGMK